MRRTMDLCPGEGWFFRLVQAERTRNRDPIWGEPAGSLYLECFSWERCYKGVDTMYYRIDLEIIPAVRLAEQRTYTVTDCTTGGEKTVVYPGVPPESIATAGWSMLEPSLPLAD